MKLPANSISSKNTIVTCATGVTLLNLQFLETIEDAPHVTAALEERQEASLVLNHTLEGLGNFPTTFNYVGWHTGQTSSVESIGLWTSRVAQLVEEGDCFLFAVNLVALHLASL